MGDDFDFSDGFDFTNPVHTALLHDTHAQLDKATKEQPPRKSSGCLGILLFTVTGTSLFISFWF